ncbi:VENN motif pre-toxin domain-containing protein, partial [Escherichia coli]
IRNKESQKQDIAGLSRDPENANGSIAPIFDREKEQKRLQEAQVISQISGQMSNIVMTYGETEAMKAARKEHPGMSDAQLRETPEYREVMKGYGTGSTPQMVVQAITGVLGGLNAGNPGQILAGGLNPAVAQLIKQATGDNREANLMAHAVWGALAAQLGGNNAASGAAGAFSGELAARYIIDNYYGGRTDNLSEQERQQISMLATIASGIAGGLAGNSTASAGTGAQAGRNAVENNLLSPEKDDRRFKALEAQKAGQNLLKASQDIFYLTNEDKYNDKLIAGYKAGKLDDAGKAELARFLNEYGTQLQLYRGMSEAEASQVIDSILKYDSIGPVLTKEYNEAYRYLNSAGVHLSQAVIGTDALLAGPGRISQLMRLSLAAGGSYQTGKGIAQVSDGKIAEGGTNIALGSAAIFGGYVGNKVVGKPSGGIISPESKVIQESSWVLDKKTHTSIPKVEAELIDKESGKIFKDTNQGNRSDYFLGDKSRPTLINDRIEAKIEKNPSKDLPNGNMASAHAEVGTIQQAFEDGITVGRDMNMRVTKEPVCGYCRGDIAAMADKAGLKSLTVYEESTGKTLYWNPGMKSLKEKK